MTIRSAILLQPSNIIHEKHSLAILWVKHPKICLLNKQYSVVHYKTKSNAIANRLYTKIFIGKNSNSSIYPILLLA